MTFVVPFAEIGAGDVALVGGKNASLGEMYRTLAPLGVRVPNGFAVTAAAYRAVVAEAGLAPLLRAALDGLDPADVETLRERAGRAQRAVLEAPLSPALRDEIVAAYRRLEAQYGERVAVAVRSSATAEDLPTASFAGQHESFLNVRGEDAVVAAYRRCLASLFLERAIHYRIDKGFDHFAVALSVGVMKMVRSEASGVAFTLDTETGFRDVVFVTAAYGLGETVVQGTVDPDEFYVHKPTFAEGFRAVLRRRIGAKAQRLVFAADDGIGATTRSEPTSPEDRARASLADVDVLEIAGACIAIEQHYGVPMDVEFAKDADDGSIFIVQARPETVASQRTRTSFSEYRLLEHARPVVSGRAVGRSIAAGPVRLVRGPADLEAFRDGEILVAATTTPDWEPVMKRAAAIVTDRGGRTCHAAIVARELGIPAIVGTGDATLRLRTGEEATVASDGETGHVYPGRLRFESREIELGALPAPPVKIMLTLGDPEAAFADALLPNDGVGLARIEFIVANEIGIHPMALAHPERVVDDAARAAIATRTHGFTSPSELFVRGLAEGVGTIAAAFYPKPVIVRMSDFKSNEYAALLGGAAFEPHEDNPMIGLRGAARYTHPLYADAFALECAAMRRVRDEMGLRNVILMIPFCRRVDEARRVIDRMAELGLRRGERGLQIYAMCEIPNNVLQIDAFSRCFDGFSIGSNDLAQLVLGVDRDSELVAFDYDERDPGVLEMLRAAVAGAHRNHRPIGICGQAPSDYPELARFLVGLGIDSMSLNPDSVLTTRAALVPLPFTAPSQPPATLVAP